MVGAVEAAIWIQTGKLLQLSIQEIIDCQGDGLGCDGGYAIDTFEYIRVHGVTTERSYPFKRINGTCQREKAKLPRYYIRGYEVVPPLDELEMMRAVARQPVMATVCSIGPYATYKKSDGILREPYMWGKIHPICHCVLVAGYDTSDQGEPYWIVKDSRGTKYGDEGYVYLYRGGPEHGPFGLYREAFYPIL